MMRKQFLIAWMLAMLLPVGLVPAQEEAPAESPPDVEAVAPEAQPEQSALAAPALPAQPTPVPERVEATVEQLEQLINAPREARLGREVDEPVQAPSLFGDPVTVQRLLGEDPRYVYIPAGEDPMIVPWVRDRVKAAELLTEAQQLYAEGKLQDALVKAKIILEQFPRTDSVGKALDLKNRIEAELRRARPVPSDEKQIPVQEQRILPPWIHENTRGVVFDVGNPDSSSVLLGDFILNLGDPIPSYPGIKVAKIEKSMVTYDYQGEMFQVMVEGR